MCTLNPKGTMRTPPAERIRQLLRIGPLTERELAETLELSSDVVRSILSGLKEDGHVRQEVGRWHLSVP